MFLYKGAVIRFPITDETIGVDQMIKKTSKKLQKEINWLLEEKYPAIYRQFLIDPQIKLPPEAENDIKRLKKGEPLAYVIGFVDFLNCRIDLSLRPLIPRPETEYWVDFVLKNERFKKDKIKCLDIFAGSGCIGLAILNQWSRAKVDFTDVDKNFLKQIKINIELNKITKNRYKIIQSDIFEKINGQYNYIFANPPYVSTGRRSNVQKSVIKFEPSRALWGGKDGLSLISQFLKNAKSHLKQGGKIFLEFSPEQRKQIEKILKEFGYQNWQFFKDQYHRWRWVKVGA